jgi:purine catabolism regulator
MSLPTLREILALPAFQGAELLSGHSRLEEPVTWVHVSELMDAWRFLSGGELLVSTGLELVRAGPEARVTFLRSLAEAGAVGLALELVQWTQEVPDEMLQTGRFLEFPLIVFRSEVRFADLTRAAHQRILARVTPPDEEPLLDSLVAALVETGRSSGFVQRQLGPVLLLPARPRSTLLSTLEALLGSQFNIAEAARRLHVRRQSLYYRLEQLRGMLGDLDEPDRRAGLLISLELLKRDSI